MTTGPSFAEMFKKARRSPGYWLASTLVDVCESLLAVMHESGIAQIEIARKAQMKASTLSRVLSADQNFTMETLVRIAFAMGYRVKVVLEPIEDNP